jgi:hypothetical protein
MYQVEGYIVCQLCALGREEMSLKERMGLKTIKMDKRSEAIKHLKDHRTKGDLISQISLLRMKSDYREEGDRIRVEELSKEELEAVKAAKK